MATTESYTLSLHDALPIYAADGDYVNWRRADFFCQWLLGDFDQTVDMWELNREQQNNGKTNGTRVTAGATTGTTTTTTTTTGTGTGGRGGRGGRGGGGNDDNN